MSRDLENRVVELEAARDQTERTLTEVLQRVEVAESRTERAWEAIGECTQDRARLEHRLGDLENAFESHWGILRRVELETLQTRKDMQLGFREMRAGFASIGARLGDAT